MNIIDSRVRPRIAEYYKDIVPKPSEAWEPYFKHFHLDPKSRKLTLSTYEESIEDMRECGITKGIIGLGDAAGNKVVYETCKKYPDTYIGMAGVRPDKTSISQAYKDLEFAYKEYDLRGFNQDPYLTGVYADDKCNYPLYALSEKMGRCARIHSSQHFSPLKRLDLGDPMQIDRIAVDFPELKIIMGHGGMGFGEIGPLIAWRMPNVYIDFTTIHPRYISKEILGMINSVLKEKAIFGTGYPGMEYCIVEEWKMRIKEENQPLFFYENAVKAFGLELDSQL